MSDKPKWTPGPWWADWDDNGQWYIEPLCVTGTKLRGDSGDCLERSNAHLIAAAPDLYEALREISDALEGAKAADPEASIEFFDELVEIEPGWRKRLKDALAKARGEKA